MMPQPNRGNGRYRMSSYDPKSGQQSYPPVSGIERADVARQQSSDRLVEHAHSLPIDFIGLLVRTISLHAMSV